MKNKRLNRLPAQLEEVVVEPAFYTNYIEGEGLLIDWKDPADFVPAPATPAPRTYISPVYALRRSIGHPVTTCGSLALGVGDLVLTDQPDPWVWIGGIGISTIGALVGPLKSERMSHRKAVHDRRELAGTGLAPESRDQKLARGEDGDQALVIKPGVYSFGQTEFDNLPDILPIYNGNSDTITPLEALTAIEALSDLAAHRSVDQGKQRPSISSRLQNGENIDLDPADAINLMIQDKGTDTDWFIDTSVNLLQDLSRGHSQCIADINRKTEAEKLGLAVPGNDRHNALIEISNARRYDTVVTTLGVAAIWLGPKLDSLR